MLSAWSQPPCSALTGSFVKGYSLSFPTLLKCVLPVCICGLSSLLKWNFLLHLIKQQNICRWKVVPPSAYCWTRRGSLSRLPLIYLSMEAFQTLLMERSVWPCSIWTVALQVGLSVLHRLRSWEWRSLWLGMVKAGACTKSHRGCNFSVPPCKWFKPCMNSSHRYLAMRRSYSAEHRLAALAALLFSDLPYPSHRKSVFFPSIFCPNNKRLALHWNAE